VILLGIERERECVCVRVEREREYVKRERRREESNVQCRFFLCLSPLRGKKPQKKETERSSANNCLHLRFLTMRERQRERER
jgi:hypothetical protein